MKKAKLISALALAASISLAAPTANAGTLTIAHTTWIGYGTLYLAKELGYFNEAGLTVDLPVIEESSIYMASQASGHTSGSASTVDEVLKYRPKMCFRTVVALDESNGGDGILATNDIQRIEDLKGKTVAVNEGSTSEFWLAYLLKQKGMSLSDITVQNMQADDAAAAFIAGHEKVAVTWEPNLSLAKSKNVGHVLADSSQTPNVIVDVVALSCDVIEKQPGDVKALVDGLFRAVDYLHQHPEESYKLIAKGIGGYLSTPDAVAGAIKGVKFYDRKMNAAFLAKDATSGGIGELLTLGNQTWNAILGMPLNVTWDDIVDPRFVTP